MAAMTCSSAILMPLMRADFADDKIRHGYDAGLEAAAEMEVGHAVLQEQHVHR